MKIEQYSNTYILDGAAIDEISERVGDFLRNLQYEKTNILRIRLSMEEALLRWRDHFGEEKNVQFELGSQFGRPFIKMTLEGEPMDPLAVQQSEVGDWADTLLSTVGLEPRYSYQYNANSIMLLLPKPKGNPAKMLLISIIIGVSAGILTALLLPHETQLNISDIYLKPVQELFFSILNVAAVPIIFLDVLSAVCGAGDLAGKGSENRKTVLHFLLLTTLVTLIGTVIAVFAFGLNASYGGADRIDGMTLIAALRNIIPSDIMTPFQAGESQQLIFLALVLGNALLLGGNQVKGLVSIVNQFHTVILFIADWVSRVTPLFVVILLVLGIWNKSLLPVLRLWEPVALFAAASVIVLGLSIAAVSISKSVSPALIIKKIKRSFLVAFRNSSVNASYALNRECCVKKLGIDGKYADNIIPFGLVLYMPTAAMALSMFSLYAASVFDVKTSALWIITVILLSVALQTATPPVSGVNLLAHAAVYSKMGIPDEALILAMVADILFCFITAAMDQSLLQMELVFEADRTGLLNKDILRRK